MIVNYSNKRRNEVIAIQPFTIHGKAEAWSRRNDADMPEPLFFQHILQSPRKPTPASASIEGPSSPLLRFGMYLGSLRRRKGLSVQDLANACGLSIETAIRLELGEASLSEYATCLPGLSEVLREDTSTLSRLLIELILE